MKFLNKKNKGSDVRRVTLTAKNVFSVVDIIRIIYGADRRFDSDSYSKTNFLRNCILKTDIGYRITSLKVAHAQPELMWWCCTSWIARGKVCPTSPPTSSS